jgi:hypothetical protein
MATTSVQTDVPLINVPFVNADGTVTEAWFIFLVQLFRRTGGTGGDTGNITLDDVLALEETFGASVSGTGNPLTAETTFTSAPPASALAEMIFAPASGSSSTAAGGIVDQTFTSGPDFTPGTTTSLTLGNSFSNASQLWVFFDGTFQGDDQYSLSGIALTFTSAIPIGVSKVYVKGLR